MQGLLISLFGMPRIERDGHPVPVERRKALALLAYVVLMQGAHGRDALAALLWPELDHERARAALRSTLASLGQALGKGWLSAEGDSVALVCGPGLEVDVKRFSALLAAVAAHNHVPARLCDACLAALREATDLYRDDFLAGFTLQDAVEFDDWQAYQSEGFRRELRGALEKLVLSHASRREFDVALPYARRWLALDPLDESAHRALMRLHAWSGDRAAAVRQYEECTRLLACELGVEPDPETQALRAAFLQSKTGAGDAASVDAFAFSPPPPSAPHNLPPDPTAFIGREKELAEIAHRLANPACRLLTVIGPGGIGKTRLAVQAARAQSDRFADGVCYVDLAPLASPELIPATILRALGVPEQGASSERQLLDFLRGKQILLVLDNFEHFLESAPLVSHLLRNGTRLKVLATSRARLGLREEWLLPLEGLDLPLDGDGREAPGETRLWLDLQGHSATALFVACVLRLRPDYHPRTEDALHVARICRRLEGIPLAIELAAAWARTLPVGEIAAELERSFDLLSTGLRDVPLRQRSMTATFDHSWRLLSRREQSILRQVSAFQGGFTREAAQAVAGASLVDLTGLADASWLRAGARGRYEMHELLRQYCEERLDAEHQTEAGESSDAVRERHSAYFGALAAAREDWENQRPDALLDSLPDCDNFRAAVYWVAEHQDPDVLRPQTECFVRISELLQPSFPTEISVWGELVDRLKSRVAKAEEMNCSVRLVLDTVWAIRCRGMWMMMAGHLDGAEAHLAEAQALLGESPAPESDDHWRRAWHRERLETNSIGAWVASFRGDYGRSIRLAKGNISELAEHSAGHGPYCTDAERRALLRAAYRILHNNLCYLGRYEEALHYARETIAQALTPRDRILGVLDVCDVLYATGDYKGAWEQGSEVLRLSREFGIKVLMGWACVRLGRIRAATGMHEKARSFLRRSAAVLREVNEWRGQCQSLNDLAAVELATGHPTEARRLYEESLALCERTCGIHAVDYPTAIVGLGRIALATGDMAEAKARFRRALGMPERAAWDTADAVTGMAEILAREGRSERAVELLACVTAWSGTPYTHRQRAERLLGELENHLLPEAFATATTRGRGQPVDEVVTGLAG